MLRLRVRSPSAPLEIKRFDLGWRQDDIDTHGFAGPDLGIPFQGTVGTRVVDCLTHQTRLVEIAATANRSRRVAGPLVLGQGLSRR